MSAILAALAAAKVAKKVIKPAMAVGQMALGAMQTKKADALLPPGEDPMSRQVLSGLKTQQAKALTGTSDMASRTAVRQMAKTAGQSAFNAGGPVNTGMLASIINPALQNINQTSAALAADYSKQIGEQTSEMAQRKSDLSTFRSTKMAAKGATNTSAGTDNLLASLGGGPGVKKKKKEEVAKGGSTAA
jgi:hypothetical protein